MARTYVGRSLTEKHYTFQRALAWGLAYLIRAFWRSLGLGQDRPRTSGVQVNSWLDQVIRAIKFYREMSLSASHRYFVDFIAIEAPDQLLIPEVDENGEPYRAAWATAEPIIDDSMRQVHRPLLEGRIAEIPGATERIVDDRIYLEQYDVEGAPTVEEVMGPGWGRDPDDPVAGDPDAPDAVENLAELDRARSRGEQLPIVLAPDPYPINDASARARMRIKGPDSYAKQAAKIAEVTPRVDEDGAPVDPMDEQAQGAARKGRLEKQSGKSFVRAANAASRLANASTEFIDRAAKNHRMGYYRVLGPNPCPFCIALAAQAAIYGGHSYDDTNLRFTGEGVAKVHDGCQCSLEPVPMNDDTQALPPGVEEARELWKSVEGQMRGMTHAEKLKYFRRVIKDGKVDERAVLKEERPEIRSRREELQLAIPHLMVELTFWDMWIENHPESSERALSSQQHIREQLEFRLQEWGKYSFPETDWSEEFEWAMQRAAALLDEQTVNAYWLRTDTPAARAAARRGEVDTMTWHYEFNKWLLESYPEANQNYDEHWSRFEMDKRENRDPSKWDSDVTTGYYE